jgi:aminoglycoside 2'-N-acetyltransferase I
VQVLTLRTAEVPAAQLQEVRALLDVAFEDFGDEDWAHSLGGWHVLVTDAAGGPVVSHAAVVARELEVDGRCWATGYVEAVATLPGRQGEGLGSAALEAVEAVIRSRFEVGALSTGRHTFYERLGWERWRGPTFVRHGGGTTRTEEDDDGVLVLRFGPSAALDLDAPISCEDRPGDAW